MAERTCERPGCGIEFTPKRGMQRYHDRDCQVAAANARARERARERAMEKRNDVPASVYLHPRASGWEAAICDVERELVEIKQPTRLSLLDSTLSSIGIAHPDGDKAWLRGELIQLAAQASEWAARLPRPITRARPDRKREAA